MSLLVFAFQGIIAARVAARLRAPVQKIYLDSTILSLEEFVQRADLANFDYILGLGMYSGRDKNALRIETMCNSQFRNRKENLQALAIPHFLQPAPGIKLAAGMGNSWCNLVSYLLLAKLPHAAYSFVHVPKGFDVATATRTLEAQLAEL